jgi:hypothetical protein
MLPPSVWMGQSEGELYHLLILAVKNIKDSETNVSIE